MLLRKFLAFLLASIIITPTLTAVLYLTSGGIFLSVLLPIIALYVVGGLFSYGIPTSVLSDWLTQKMTEVKRRQYSFWFHVLSGVSFIFILGILADPSTLFNDFITYWTSMYPFFFGALFAAIVLWLCDEWVRIKRGK
ncbi:hypothetical protein [Alkalibacillus haloalkaliphilus]|uniref:hypothetical protein n=1 Tax=Alkalibacillus haloalkaliphilus TaxID=94136 RepID=UPI0029356269|nr:hypothetical protein [Alkalibacillus haloalkaliphilus]MDV2583098.1 hypothetical protein [Alkalibacillus haloalkaliphilus]